MCYYYDLVTSGRIAEYDETAIIFLYIWLPEYSTL